MVLLLLACSLGSACSGRKAPEGPDLELVDQGIASWYGPNFHGRLTANGEIYDMHSMTAAHKTLPFGSVVEVVNLDNGKKITVRINDRGPFIDGRVIDLSKTGAKKIGLIGPGLANVEVLLLKPPAPDRYALQAGAFRDPARAQSLHARLAPLAPTAHLHSTEGWHRVLLGPYETYDQARKRRKELARKGIDVIVRRLPEGEGEL